MILIVGRGPDCWVNSPKVVFEPKPAQLEGKG